LCFAQKQRLYGVEHQLTALKGIEGPPLRVIALGVKQRKQGRKHPFKGTVEAKDFAGEPFSDLLTGVVIADAEIDFEELD
jgi:hypothetical protein